MKRTTPSGFYFTNTNLIGSKTFPSLSNDTSRFVEGAAYQQGDIALFGVNDTKEFYIDDDNREQWQPVKGNGFATDNDRLLVPLKFKYTFDKADEVTQSEFILRDSSGNIITSISVKDENVLQTVVLNFRDLEIVTLTDTAEEKISYSLEVTGNNGYVKTTKLFFFDDLNKVNNDIWGILQVTPKVSDSAFNLLDNAGLLFTRKTADGTINAHPIFEIRIKSRLIFWRYINDNKKRIKSTGYPTDFLNFKEGKLITKQPRAATYLPTFFRKSDNTFHYLPNPVNYDMIKSEEKRLYADILVPESSLFPVEAV